jgi:GNAT superfamily N-acetyltransferase
MGEPVQGHDYVVMRLSQCPPDDARVLLKDYDDQVYSLAFPEADLREYPPDWVQYFDGSQPSPAPWTEVILLVAGNEVWGGVTIEYYREARAGLLTYIAISPRHRGKRLGHVLVAEARKALAERGGADTPMFAETERYEDAHDDEEREATVLRQRQLTRLGALAVGFDYVMPPLRPDASPRTLHLLLLDPPAPGRAPMVSAAKVLALLDELARSLGTDLAAHPATAAMQQSLKTDRSLMLGPLPAVHFDELFRETPVFADVGAIAFSFAFELRFQHKPGCPLEGSALLLTKIAEDLNRDARVQAELVEPTRSFLDDVTTGPPGRNGRPLLFLAGPQAFDHPSRRVRMIRPPHWLYKAEDSRRQLRTNGAAIDFVLQDSFCVFESGRVFYVMTLVLDPQAGSRMDEYAIIQLQNLAMKPNDDDQVRQHGDLAFDWQPSGQAPGDLWELAERRLTWLEERCPEGQPCAVRDIIERFEIQPRGAARLKLEPCDLKNLCVSIENEAIIAAAETANCAFAHDGTGGSDHALIEAPHFAAPFGSVAAGPPPHQDPDISIDRKMLALAGLATGVPDFPWQDTSEVHDSTRPAGVAVDAVMYVHPRFTLEVAREWRSFHHSRENLGNCPYLLLMWLASLHDELIVEAIEQGINDMVYGPAGTGDGYRTMAMADVDQIRRQSRRILGSSGNRLLERNLQRRFDLFRFHAIHRSGKIFRYPKEKGALEHLLEEKGITQRFERAQELIDRIEGLVDDVTSIKSAFAERRTNLALAVIGALGAFSVFSEAAEMFGPDWAKPLVTALLACAALVAVVIYVFWPDLRANRRK